MKNKRQSDLEKLDGEKKPKVLGVLVFLFAAAFTCAIYWLVQFWIFG